MNRESSFAARGDEFIDRAREARGLGDVGTGFEDAYHRLLDAFDSDVNFSESGLQTTEHAIQGLFDSRLVVQEQWRLHPEFRKVGIARPLVITGIPRSGTTALHKLMSIDSQFQGIELWLTRTPKPRPPREQWPEDGDYHQMCQILDAMIATSPEFLSEHGMHVDDVDESLMVLQHTFVSNAMPSQWGIPSYERWYREQDETPGYRHLADVMRLVGLHTPERIWLLKNPTDTYSLDAVLNVFPDARIVQTHRDPVQSIPSLVNLSGGAWRAFVGPHADLTALMVRETDFWAEAMRRAKIARVRSAGPVVDVEFVDFVRDQMGTVRRIYDAFELTLRPETEQEMLNWLAANPRRPGAIQRHVAEDYGMASDRIREVCAEYRAQRNYG